MVHGERKPFARFSLSAALLAVVFLPGCGGGARATYPVRGKVVFSDGSAVTAGIVEFESSGGDPINARGRIAPDGTFQLGTYSDADGAVLGEHRAIVLTPVDMSILPEQHQEHHGSRAPLVDPRFGRYDKSGLKFTVHDEPNEIKIVVEKAR